MKLNIRTNITLAAIAAMSLLVSCANSDEYDFATTGKPMISAPQTSFTVAEGETLMIPINVDNPVNIIGHFQLTVVNTEAEEGEDFVIPLEESPGDWGIPGAGYRVEYPAYAESFEIPFEAISDLVPAEGSETVTLRLTTAGNRNILAPEGGITFEVNIQEVEGETLEMVFDWGNEITYNGETYDACATADIDVYISPAAGFNINNPFATALADYQAATGACPEHFTIDPANYPDGDYVLFTDIWANDFAGVSGAEGSYAIETTFAQPGVFNETYTQSEAQAFDVSAAPGSFNGLIATITVQNGTYTITPMN